ncbi:MAG: hypothetical protein LBU66_06120 [Treponema sp.]|nr:hypothetical protein [Treponema sp.]
MCFQNITRFSVFLAVLAAIGSLVLFCGCDAVEMILPSAGTYKLNAKANNTPFDECSFIDASSGIIPYFEEPVLNDPDITALVVFLRDSKGEIAGWKALYIIDENYSPDAEIEEANENGNTSENTEDPQGESDAVSEADDAKVRLDLRNGSEIVIPVKNLDDALPYFPMPDLPMGRYTIVFQVMSGKNILQRTEKEFFYLGNIVFSCEGINVHLPGITDNSQLIPKGLTVMLEAKTDYDSRFNPYIVWYNGSKKISEGSFSDGAGNLLWKAPELSGFFSLSAEIFPIQDYEGFAGYKKEISLLISSKPINVHLISEDITELVHWYTLDGNLNDSKMPASLDRALKPAASNKPAWTPANGTYGLATGYDNVFVLPKVSISGSDILAAVPEAKNGKWQILTRFKPLNEGGIFSVQFGALSNIYMRLSLEGQNLVLTLVSPSATVRRTLKLPNQTAGDWSIEQESFITTGVSFSVSSGKLSAKINILGENVEQGELAADPVALDIKTENDFQIFLGFNWDIIKPVDESGKPVEQGELSGESGKSGEPDEPDEPNKSESPAFTALWDEFALYYMPPMDVIAADIKYTGIEEQLESPGEIFPDEFILN